MPAFRTKPMLFALFRRVPGTHRQLFRQKHLISVKFIPAFYTARSAAFTSRSRSIFHCCFPVLTVKINLFQNLYEALILSDEN